MAASRRRGARWLGQVVAPNPNVGGEIDGGGAATVQRIAANRHIIKAPSATTVGRGWIGCRILSTSCKIREDTEIDRRLVINCSDGTQIHTARKKRITSRCVIGKGVIERNAIGRILDGHSACRRIAMAMIKGERNIFKT